MKQKHRNFHNALQRDYYDLAERARIAVTESIYVKSHTARMIDIAQLSPADSILEVGSGLGKFTLPLNEQGFAITANDLSPNLLERLNRSSQGKIQTLCCDIHDIRTLTDLKFDKIIGFFVLHHLIDFSGLFQELSKTLKPGGTIAFCEPVAMNPLYYLQILLTPGMRFSAEPSITAMRPSIIHPAMQEAGFIDVQSRSYGYFPPFLKNRGWGDRLEQQLDKAKFIPFPNAFQIFTARLPD